MRTFLDKTRKASWVALIAILVGIPGCSQIDVSTDGATIDAIPGWAALLSVVGFVGFLVALVLVPSRLAVRGVLFVRESRLRRHTDKPPGS